MPSMAVRSGASRARDLLALIALFGIAALVAMFRLLRPEQLARPEGFRDLVDFIAALRAAGRPDSGPDVGVTGRPAASATLDRVVLGEDEGTLVHV